MTAPSGGQQNPPTVGLAGAADSGAPRPEAPHPGAPGVVRGLTMRALRRWAAIAIGAALGGGVGFVAFGPSWGWGAFVGLSGGAALALLTLVALLDAWFAPRRSVEDWAAWLGPHIAVVKPAGPGPFPVVLQFHGCGGLRAPGGPPEPLREYAEAAAASGVAVLIIDSLAPRGLDRAAALARVCKGRCLRGVERAADVFGAVAYARAQPWVKPQQIALAGWSHGAWAIMDALSFDLDRTAPPGVAAVSAADLDGVKAVHLTYPYCGFPARTAEEGWALAPRTRLVQAENDDTALPIAVERAVSALHASGVVVERTLIAHVTHAFDEAEHEPGASYRVDRAAAAEARAAYARWLADTLAV